jgi:hypothetical protein
MEEQEQRENRVRNDSSSAEMLKYSEL